MPSLIRHTPIFFFPKAFAFAVLATLLCVAGSIRADTFSWDKTAFGTYAWDNSANWSPNTGFPNAPTDQANLNNAIAGAMTIELNQAISLATLNLGTAGNANSFTIGTGTSGSFIWNNTSALGLFELNLGGSGGVTHTITAPVNLTDTLNHRISNLTGSTANLTISGLLVNDGDNRLLTNNLLSGNVLTLSGGVNLSESNTGRTLTLAGSGATTMSGVIADGGTGAGALVLANSGNVRLNSSTGSTYTGGTTVGTTVASISTPGRLTVNNTSGSGTGSGAVTVNELAALGGTGIIAPTTGVGGANVIVNVGAGANLGGRIDPGEMNGSTPLTGTLTIGTTSNNVNTVFNAVPNRRNSSGLRIDVDGTTGAGGHDRLDVNGNLTLGNTTDRVVLEVNLFGNTNPNFDTTFNDNLIGGGTFTGMGMVILSYTGTLTGAAINATDGPFRSTTGATLGQGATFAALGEAYNFRIYYLEDGRVVLAAVPEPGSTAFLAIVGLGFATSAWRRRARG